MLFLTRVYNLIKSVKMAIYILSALAITSLAASLLPQGLERDYYLQHYGLAGRVLVTSGFADFFRSPLFFLLMFCFMLNLSLCTFHRIRGHYRQGKVLNVGPDIIHIGIIILVLGGLLSQLTRAEQFNWFGRGDSFRLYGRYELEVAAVEFSKYPDGRPRDWITHLRLKDGGGAHRAVKVEVNSPLKVGNLKIYQHSYNEQHTLKLADPEGQQFTVKSKELISIAGVDYLFAGIDSIGVAEAAYQELVFLRRAGGGAYEELRYKPDEMLDSYKVVDYSSQLYTGLNFVRDEGQLPLWAGIILVLLGVCWTYVIKLGEIKDDSD